jgi:hypothetical protein
LMFSYIAESAACDPILHSTAWSSIGHSVM